MPRKRKATRRSKSTGSVYRLPDGRWRAQIAWTEQIGERKVRRYKRQIAPTYEQALAAVASLDRAQPDGMISSAQTVADAADQWLTRTVAPKKLKPGTVAGYRQDLERALPAIGHLSLEIVAQRDSVIIEELVAYLAERYSAYAVRRTVARLQAVFALAYTRRLIDRNPAAALDNLPRKPEHDPYPFTVTEIWSLLTAAAGSSLYALYYLAVITGMREGELLGLRWQDVDFEHGRLSVRQALDNYTHTMSTPKTRKSRREIYVSEKTVAVLRDHRARVLAQRLLLNPKRRAVAARVDVVFPSRFGTPLPANSMLRRFKRHLTDAELPAEAIHFHHIRHFFREQIAERIPPHVVADLMGHEDTKTSFEVYGRQISDKAKRAAATALDDMLEDTG